MMSCLFGLVSCNVYCLVAGICQAYVLGICMHGTHNNNLIRIAFRVVQLLLELLEAF